VAFFLFFFVLAAAGGMAPMGGGGSRGQDADLNHCQQSLPCLGIPIFGSDFWDPHQKRNSGSVSDSKNSGRKNFNQIPLLKNREIEIPIPKFGIQKK
jgi:hypothetical protein